MYGFVPEIREKILGLAVIPAARSEMIATALRFEDAASTVKTSTTQGGSLNKSLSLRGKHKNSRADKADKAEGSGAQDQDKGKGTRRDRDKGNKGKGRDYSGTFAEIECYNCHKKGHKSFNCPEPKNGNETPKAKAQ